MQRVVAEAMQRVGDIDILVNNAGATWGAPMDDHPLEAWDKVMNLNVRSLFLFCAGRRQGQHAAARAGPHPQRRVDRRPGRLARDAAFIAYARARARWSTSRATLAGEWGPYGINVNALAPGFFPSKMTRGTLAAVGVDKLAEAAPLRRLGDDDDLKGAALLLCSDAGKHITGQILAIDGGLSAVHHGA